MTTDREGGTSNGGHKVPLAWREPVTSGVPPLVR